MDPDRLSIELTERILEYDPALLAQWRDPGWWDAEGWREVVPETEWHWAPERWRIQAARGYHFVEVMYMRLAEAEGFRCRYEGYNFFEPPSPTATQNLAGYALIESAFGADRLARLQEAAHNYWMAYELPATPDLFVYRQEGEAIVPVRFVELKHKDAIARKQALGLALIQEILEASVEISRYVPAGTQVTPKTYRDEWPRRGFIRR